MNERFITNLSPEEVADLASLCELLPDALSREELAVYIALLLRSFFPDSTRGRLEILYVVARRILQESTQ